VKSESLLPLAVPAALMLTRAVESSVRSSNRSMPRAGRQARDGRGPRRDNLDVGESSWLRRANFMFCSGKEGKGPRPSWRQARQTVARLKRVFSGITAQVPSVRRLPAPCSALSEKRPGDIDSHHESVVQIYFNNAYQWTGQSLSRPPHVRLPASPGPESAGCVETLIAVTQAAHAVVVRALFPTVDPSAVTRSSSISQDPIQAETGRSFFPRPSMDRHKASGDIVLDRI